MLLLALALAPRLMAATAGWTNLADGSVGYWTNNPNWNAASYPGSGAGEFAYLTNSVAASYTAILDKNVQTLSGLTISNAAVGGQVRLIVTNAALTNTTLRLGTGGRLQIDNGGLVTGVNTLDFSGNGGTIVLNSNGTLTTSISGGNLGYGNQTGVTGLVTSTSAQGGTWNLGGNSIFIANGPAASNNVLAISGVNVTNVGSIRIGQGSSISGVGPSAGNSLVISNGASLLSSGGAVNLGVYTNDNNNTFFVGGAGAASMVSVGGLTISAGGTTNNAVVVTNATLSSSSTVAVGAGSVSVLAGGTMNVSSTFSLGSLAGNTGTLVLAGGQLNLGGNLTAGSGVAQVLLSGGTAGAMNSWSSALNMTLTNAPGTGTIVFAPTNAAHSITLSGTLGGNGNLVKDGAGQLVLSGSNTWSGATTISNGTLSISLDTNLGATASLSFAGGLLQVTGNTVSNLSARTVNWSTFNGGFDINAANNLFTVTNAMAGTGGLTKNGAGTLFLSAANTFTNSTIVNLGMLVLSNQGAIAASTSVTVNTGATVLMDNRNGSADRLGNTAALNLNGGTVALLGAGSSETNGPLVLGMGASSILVTNGASLVVGSLARSAGGVLNMTSNGTVAVTAAPTLTGGILPYVTINNADFASYVGGTLQSNTAFATSFTAFPGVSTNIKTGAGLLAGDATENSLLLTGGTLTNNGTLTLTSGGLLMGASSMITNGTLAFGGVEGILINSGTATLASRLTGSGGLTKAGAGTLTFLGTNQNTGLLRIVQGSLMVGEGGVVNGDVLVNSGTFNMNGGVATLGSLVVTNTTVGATQTLTLGYGTLTTTNGVILNSGANFGLGGVVGKTMTWNMLGGTNVTGTTGSILSFSVGGAVSSFNTGVVVVAGPTTVWSNGMSLWVGGNLNTDTHTNSLGQLVISNGAVVYITVGANGTTPGLVVGSRTAGSSLTIADGGKLYYNTVGGAVALGYTTSSSNDTLLVTGTGSVLDTTTNRPINVGLGKTGTSGGHRVTVASNATVVTAGLAIGGQFDNSGRGTGTGDGGVGSNNMVLVYGSGTLWSNANASSGVYVGWSGAGNLLVVSNNALFTSLGKLVAGQSAGGTSNQILVLDGGRVTAASVTIGNAANASGNSVWVSGSSSFLMSTGALVVGNNAAAAGNMLVISNGGKVYSGGNSYLGTAKGAALGKVILTGSGSLWTNASLLFAGQSNVLQVLDQAVFQSMDTTMGDSSSGTMSSNNVVVVANQGVWTNLGSLNVGQYGNGNQFLVTNGGTAYVAGNVSVGKINAVPNAGQLITNNLLLVSDSGSRMTIGSSLLVGDNNQQVLLPGVGYVVVSNGAQMIAGNVYVSGRSNVNACVLDISGPGSLLRTTAFYVGRDASVSTGSNGLARISGGATLDVADLRANENNAITNFGGVFQFATNAPTITAGTTGSIVATSATIAFRDAANVNIRGNWGVGALGRSLTNITFAGDNAFRLNNSATTNGGQDYVFNTGLGATNYTRLEMINGTTLWQGGSLTIGGGGTMLVSNTAATIANAFTNQGSVRVVGSTLTLGQPLVVTSNASFTLVHATNVLNGGLVIASNAFYGGSGRVESGPGVTSFGTISPGNSPGTLTFSSNLTLLDSSVLHFEIAGTNALDYDHLIVEGTLFMGGSIYMTNLVGWTFAKGDTFNFIDATNWSGHFLSQSSWILPDLAEDLQWDTTLFETQGIMSVMSIPEPSSFIAVGAGLAFLAFLRRRKGA